MKEIMKAKKFGVLEFKVEDETATGMPMGKLIDASGAAVFPDGQWVTKATALRIARQRGVELFES